MKRLERATTERAAQEEAFEAFTANQMAEVPEWTKAVEDFEADASKPNPYEMPSSGTYHHLHLCPKDSN